MSNRDAPNNGTQNQIYFMRVDGGEAWKVTDAREGVTDFNFTRDGKSVIYRTGRAGEQQLYRLPIAGIEESKPEQLTRQSAGVGDWSITPDDKRIYFVTDDTLDADERARREKRFTVNIRNAETPLASLWALDLADKKATRLTNDQTITVANFTISPDSRYVGFRGTSANRYERNITESSINSDLFLLDGSNGQIERLTNNKEVGEGAISFSTDSKWIAFSAPDDLTRYTMKNQRVYLRAVSDRGGQWRKLGASFDGNVTTGFWSEDGKTIYFNEGIRATNQLMALDVASGTVKQVTNEKASLSVSRDQNTGKILINYSDPRTPGSAFTVASIDQVANKSAWKQLTDPNPQVRSFTLGDAEEITWKSKDGKMVGGVLLKPANYQAGQRYPLIVAIHGGPAAADVLGFNGGYG